VKYYIQFDEGIEGHRHIRHNLNAGRAPLESDNADDHYGVGSLWVWDDSLWILVKIHGYYETATWLPIVAGTLSGLSDLDLSALGQGSILVYDVASGEWQARQLSEHDDFVVMRPDLTEPPEPILNVDGDGWVYAPGVMP